MVRGGGQILLGALCAAVGALGGVHARALDAPAPPALSEILVIGTTPVPGLHVDADKVPGNVQSLYSSDLTRNGAASLSGALDERLGGVNLNDMSADPFAPDILYRGFTASPVLGTPQGLAVYQNGVRINEAFGDSVNWDLVPDIAIDRVDLISSSPLFGLNALGGALSLTLKNGFTHPGGDAEFSGGSFDQHGESAQWGFNRGTLGMYAAVRILNQNGWRRFAHDAVKQYYLDVSLRGDGPTVDLSYSRGDNHLNSRGAAPLQSLALDPRDTFTGPQGTTETLDFLTLNAAYGVDSRLAAQSVLYFRNYRQRVTNGDSSDYTRCTDLAALCQSDAATPVTDLSGALIPDISENGTRIIGQDDFESVRSQSWGGSLQFTSTAALAGHGNTFAMGATLDTAQTYFTSGAQVGEVDAALTVLPSPYQVATPEGGEFSATPVMLEAHNKFYGLFATDTWDGSSRLAVTLSGRYNVAKVELADLRGAALNGTSRFTRFNPAIGATYKLNPVVTFYLGYSTNNRAPTPSEIECSDPLKSCVLPTSLAGDPPTLKQVIAQNYETGIRGRLAPPSWHGALTWNAGLFRTHLKDDIYGVATSVSRGYFQNIGATQRQGFESGGSYRTARWRAYAQFSAIDATFLSPLRLNSPSNPFQDAQGNITVRRGDRLPLIPRTRIKLGAEVALTASGSLGATLTSVGSSFYKGDESNQNPQLPGYAVLGLRGSYRLARGIELIGTVQNVLDHRYSTSGLYGNPVGVGAPGIPPDTPANDPGVDNRFQSPAMPRAFFGGLQLEF